jgi:hypothetical protein
VAGILVFAACGKSESPPPASIVISPTTASVAPGGAQAFTATGGSGTGFAWSLSTNASGGSIGATTGLYTSGSTGGVTDVVQVTDSAGAFATRNVTVTAGLTISPATASVAPRGTQNFTASGGSGSGYVWSFVTNASTGTIDASTGAYVAGSTSGVTDVIRATDSLGNTATRDIAVGNGLTISPATASVAPRGTQNFTASGGSGSGYVWSLSASPSGGSITSGGVYTAGSTGSVTDVVRVQDSLGNSGTRNVTVTAGVSISPATASVVPGGSQTFTASGGSGTGFAWTLSTNVSGGTINGSSGAYVAGATAGTDVVRVQDSLGNFATRNVSVTNSLSISGASTIAPRGTTTFTASGGSGTGYAWSISTNVSGGTINGSMGAYTAGGVSGTDVVRVQDSLGGFATQNVVVGAGVSIAPATVVVAAGGTQAFTASGGSGTGFAWSISTNASGGTINASTGAYTAGATPGTDVVRVQDSLGNFATRNVTVGAAVAIAPATLTIVVGGTQTFTATGGSETGYAWSISTNVSGGTINGSTGAYTAGGTIGTDVVRVQDSLGNFATRNVTVVAAVSITPATATVTVGGTQTFTATGGSGTGYAWSISTNVSGGTINASTGAYVAGATAGTDVVRVQDSLGNFATRSVTVAAAVVISPATAVVIVGGSQVFTATGGTGSGYVWSVTTAAPGPYGSIVAGTGAYTAGATPGTDVVRVQDSAGNFATRNVGVTAVVQRWASPSTWGGTTSFWDDADPLLVQHATFNATGNIVETKGLSWNANPGVSGVPFIFPSATRYGAGPFSSNTTPWNPWNPPTAAHIYLAASGSDTLNLTGDMLVCAVIKPDWNPGSLGTSPDDPAVDNHERIIIAKGIQGVSGWVLMQMHTDWCFHWQDGTVASTAAGMNMNWSPTAMPFYAPGGPPDNQATLNPSYVVVCGGRDRATNQIIVAANSFQDTRFTTTPIPAADVMTTTTLPATIGGYSDGDLNHVFNGRVYETAVWNEPATQANVQAKMAAVLGIALPAQADGSTPIARYSRETEAPYPALNGTWFPAAGGGYHTAWRHQPRFDPSKGMLIGLQGLNRVSLPEAFGRWNQTTGAGVASNVPDPAPPGDSERTSADQVILAAGANLSLPLGTFRTRPPTSPTYEGPIQGQIWIYPVSASGTLRVHSDAPRATENKTFTAGAGTLLPGTYSYKVTAVNGTAQESAASVETSLAVATAGASNGVNVNWRAVQGAVSYNVYGRTAGSEGLLANVAALTYLDNGTVTPGIAPPTPTWTTPWDLGTQDINLASLTAGTWTRVYLNGLTTNGYQTPAGQATVYLQNPGGSSIDFNAWGMGLTQVSGGWPTSTDNDPGPTMYDTLTHPAPDPASGVYDVLDLPPVPASTATTGFCLSIDAAPAARLTWNTVLDDPRTLINWKNVAGTQTVRLIIGGADYSTPGGIVLRVTNPGSADFFAHANTLSFATETGVKHTLRACISPAGLVEIYADGTNVTTGTPTLPFAVPDLQGGTVQVGSDGATPFHGYLSKALVCAYTTSAANCQ